MINILTKCSKFIYLKEYKSYGMNKLSLTDGQTDGLTDRKTDRCQSEHYLVRDKIVKKTITFYNPF